MNTTIELFLKTVITFFILLLYTRLLGKKQMSQLTYFNYITGLVLGTITATVIFQTNFDFFQKVMVLTTWCLLSGLLDFLTFKVQGLKTIINGKATIVIENGKIDKKALKKQRLTIEELRLMMRELKIFSIKEIDFAILETNGKLSVLKNTGYQNVTKNDMKLTIVNPLYLPTEVINNGQVLKRNLKCLQLSEDFVLEEVKKAGLKLNQILYAEVGKDGNIYFDIEKGSK